MQTCLSYVFVSKIKFDSKNGSITKSLVKKNLLLLIVINYRYYVY